MSARESMMETTLLAEAAAALGRLKAREGEDLEQWAGQLAKDSVAMGESEFQTTAWFVCYEIHRGRTHILWAHQYNRAFLARDRPGRTYRGSECFMLILGSHPWLEIDYA